MNLGNHFTESTFKQFFYERVKFKPDFDSAFKIIENSEVKKMILYRDKIDLLSNGLDNHKGKIWNICYGECYQTPYGFKILSENFLHGGLKLSFWENK